MLECLVPIRHLSSYSLLFSFARVDPQGWRDSPDVRVLGLQEGGLNFYPCSLYLKIIVLAYATAGICQSWHIPELGRWRQADPWGYLASQNPNRKSQSQ